jgi:hypothetical protein
MDNTSIDMTGATFDTPAHHRWLPIEALQPGMVLAKPIHVAQHGVLTMKLGEGTELKANTIEQLFSRGVECVPIRDEPAPDNAVFDAQQTAHIERLLVIFASKSTAEVPAECRDLFDALVMAGPQK